MLDVLRHPVDLPHAAFVVFQVVDHHLVPQVEFLQILHQIGVHHGELAGQVRFHEQVLIGGLDGLRHPGDIGDGGGGGDGHHIGVAHAGLSDALAQGLPVEAAVAVHLKVVRAALLRQQLQRVDGQDALIPQRAFIRLVAPPLLRQFA